jgi:hypothetical protein
MRARRDSVAAAEQQPSSSAMSRLNLLVALGVHMAKPSRTVPPASVLDATLPMSVANMTFMLDRLSEDCAPLQYVRELTQNAVMAILATPDRRGDIIWDVDWNRHSLTGVYKLAIIDTGVGMTGEEMVNYLNKLSSSMHEQSATGNFGVGAKIAAAPRNKQGLVYLSWKNGVGYMIHLWRDPDTDVYGLRQFERPDGTFGYWATVESSIKPPEIDQHGTMVILLGNDDDENTMLPPAGTPMPSVWILRYLNTRYFRFPEGVSVKAREGWDLPKEDKHNFLRTVTGQKVWLDENAIASGIVDLTDAKAHWWVLKDAVDTHSRVASGGHTAALFQDELYELMTGRAGVTRLQAFGVIFGHHRVVIYVEPQATRGHRVTSNTARTHLLFDGDSLPWSDWAAEFRDKLPDAITKVMDDVASGSTSTDHRQSIRDRLKQIRDLFRISRYRPVPDGSASIDEETAAGGGKPANAGREKGSGTGSGGKRGGRAGDIYALFLTAQGTPGEEFRFDQDPEVTWVSATDGTRTPPDMEDRAAKFLPHQNRLLINADFRVFKDMVNRWTEKYSQAPAARTVVEQIVQEWFEQQLVEAILGTQALRDSKQWSMAEMEKIWSEEALTAVVMPRYHIEMNVRRALGAKLGTLKERVA